MSGIAVLWVAVDRDASHSVCFLHALAMSSDPLRTKSQKPKTKNGGHWRERFQGRPQIRVWGLEGGALACSESGRVAIMDWCMDPSTKTEFRSSEDCYSLSLSRAQYL